MSISDKLLNVAENEQKVAQLNNQLSECLGGGTVSENDVINEVYEAGQKSMVDETKIIRKTVKGVGVGLTDISETPHDIGIKLVSDTITDFSKVKVTKLGTNNYDMDNHKLYDNAKLTYQKLGDNSISITALKGSEDAYVFLFQYVTGLIPNTRYFISASSIEGAKGYLGVRNYDQWSGAEKCGISPTVLRGGFVTDNTGRIMLLYYPSFQTAPTQDTTTVFNNIQIELGSTTEYQPPKIETVYANADGTVEGLTHISPKATFTTDNTEIEIECCYNKSYGVQSEYDRFWDLFQNYGNRKNYDRTFCSAGWDIITFKPKYNIVPTDATELFYNFNRNNFNNTGTIDMVEHLKNIGIELDLSNATTIQYFACFSRINRFGKLDLKKVTQMAQGFVYCNYLKTIDELILYETNGTYTSTFEGCTELTNITIGGVIANNFKFSWCTKLTHDSLMSIINHLKDFSGTTTTKTLTLGTTNLAKLTDEEKAIATDKGWTLA